MDWREFAVKDKDLISGRVAVKQMDTNKDGVVDSAEFAAAAGTKQEFNRCDKGGGGVLDADEMALRSAAKQKAVSDVRGGCQWRWCGGSGGAHCGWWHTARV